MNKNEIKQKYVELSNKLGRKATRQEFTRNIGISRRQIDRMFGSFNNLKWESSGSPISENKPIQVQGKNLDSVLESCGVDTNVWEVSEYNAKELTSGDFLFTVYFKRKKNYLDVEKFKQDILNISPEVSKIKRSNDYSSLLCEYSFPDFHYSKFAWAEECGENYDSKIAAKLLREATAFTIEQIKNYPVSQIIVPIGNDFFQSDTLTNTTTAGTAQDVDSRHHKMFRDGYKLVIEIINKLKEIAPVHIISVPGNHDQACSLYMAELLDCYFHNDENVSVDTRSILRKYYTWGQVLLGFTHGNREKINDLAVLMATEKPKDWANTKYREWHLGHFHTRRGFMDEKCGVLTRILASLSAADSWHFEKGYTSNIRGTTSFIYDKDKGKIAEFCYNV